MTFKNYKGELTVALGAIPASAAILVTDYLVQLALLCVSAFIVIAGFLIGFSEARVLAKEYSLQRGEEMMEGLEYTIPVVTGGGL